jgi:hypothetical protein
MTFFLSKGFNNTKYLFIIIKSYEVCDEERMIGSLDLQFMPIY